VEEDEVKKIWDFRWKLLLAIGLLIGLSWGTCWLGNHFAWDWGDFWSNFISNAGSTAVIGIVLYWIITRPDEKKATKRRMDQALAMLKMEFKTDLDRARLYGEALKNPQNDLALLYPLRFTRGAWNALRESGFLPQLDDVQLIYELLQVNEIITVANSSFSTIRGSKAANKKNKLNRYTQKAINECAQIAAYLDPIVAQLETMKLPEVNVKESVTTNDIPDDEDSNDVGDTNQDEK
jgi:hypothetical protein